MSTIEDVRAAEQKLQTILAALKQASADDPENLRQALATAKDEYGRAIRELTWPVPSFHANKP